MLLLLVRFFDNLNSDNQKFEALEADPSLLVKSSEFECRCSCQWRHLVPPTKPTPLPLRRQPQAATSIKLVEPSFDTIWLQIFFLSATISVVIFSLLQQDLFLSGFFCKTLRAKKIPGFSRTRKVSEANPSQAENQISPKKNNSSIDSVL